MALVRHFTATGFVVHDGHVALHGTPRSRSGCHREATSRRNEDPVQAVLREIREETGLETEVVSTSESFDLPYPKQVQPPLTIMVEDIHDPVAGYHQHIDMIYVCRPVGPVPELRDGWRWVSESELAGARPLSRDGGTGVPPPQDVRTLAALAFKVVVDER